ncbi:hypothetical protein I4U23_006624 [Adineta vaga]|nr:hypothetical protein I4U23_006624 [Adineta vaga]
MSTQQPPIVGCWVDRSIGEAGAYLQLKQKFEGALGRIVKWHYFDTGDTFKKFLTDNPNMKLVTIMSGNFARQYITPVSHMPALHSVYVYCGDKTRYQSIKNDEPKVKGVFDMEDDLLQQIKVDLQREFQ